MKVVETIVISKDFSDAPGARYKTDGPKSGEEFYETLLCQKFKSALEKGGKLLIDLDDTWGYASSFISGSFGRLSEEFGAKDVLKTLNFKSEDSPLLVDKIRKEIQNPNQT